MRKTLSFLIALALWSNIASAQVGTIPPAGFTYVNGTLTLTDTPTDGAELLVNPDFTGSATGWSLDANWAYAANAVTHTTGVADAVDQTALVTISESGFYQLTITQSAGTAGSGGICVGNELLCVDFQGVEGAESYTVIGYLVAGDHAVGFGADESYDGTITGASLVLKGLSIDTDSVIGTSYLLTYEMATGHILDQAGDVSIGTSYTPSDMVAFRVGLTGLTNSAIYAFNDTDRVFAGVGAEENEPANARWQVHATELAILDLRIMGGNFTGLNFEADDTIGVSTISTTGSTKWIGQPEYQEQLTNPDFTGSATGWTLGANWTWGADAIEHTPGSVEAVTQGAVVVGSLYANTNHQSAGANGEIVSTLGGVEVGTFVGSEGDVTGTALVAASTTDGLALTPTTDYDGTISQASVQLVPDLLDLRMSTDNPIFASIENYRTIVRGNGQLIVAHSTIADSNALFDSNSALATDGTVRFYGDAGRIAFDTDEDLGVDFSANAAGSIGIALRADDDQHTSFIGADGTTGNFTISTDGFGAALSIDWTTGVPTFPAFASAGPQFACFDADGALYASAGACVL